MHIDDATKGRRVRLQVADLWRTPEDLAYYRREGGYDGRDLTVLDVLDTPLRGKQVRLVEGDNYGYIVFMCDPSELTLLCTACNEPLDANHQD